MECSPIKIKGKAIFILLSLTLLIQLTVISGCMTVRNLDTANEAVAPKAEFSGKTLAILPVYGDEALSTDSQLLLMKSINKELDTKISQNITDAKIITSKKTIQILNNNNKLDLLDDLIKTFNKIGVFDNRSVKSLTGLLKCNYLVASRLNCENVNIVIANAFGVSLDVVVVDRNNNIAWNGTGDYKIGGIFGFGQARSTEAAKEVVNLAFTKW